MRYAFQRKSGWFILAIMLYVASGLFWILGSLDSDDMGIAIALAFTYVLIALLCRWFSRGKKQLLLVIPFAFFAILLYAMFAEMADTQMTGGSMTKTMFRLTLIAYAVGLVLFFVSLFSPGARFWSAGGFFVALIFFFLFIHSGATINQMFSNLEDFSMISVFYAFMIPQALHALTPRIKVADA